MSSAWNWAGILAWLILIAYCLIMIGNIHSRKKKAIRLIMTKHRSGAASDLASRNFRITSIEIIVLLVLFLGVGKARFHTSPNVRNSTVVTRCKPLDWIKTGPSKKHPKAKPRSYYLEIIRGKSRSLKQNYKFAISDRKVRASDHDTMILTNPRRFEKDPGVPYRLQKLVKRYAKRGDRKYHRVWAIRVATVYKNTPGNGIGLHAGQKRSSYTVIRLPSRYRSLVYFNNHKLHRKKAKMMK